MSSDWDLEKGLVLSSVEETRALGRRIAQGLLPGAVVGLCGPLGAGKTEVVRGIAEGLGIKERISSPTFVLECVYNVEQPEVHRNIFCFSHWDLYRLQGEDFEAEIMDASRDKQRVTVIEWPERIAAVFGLLDLKVDIRVEDLPLGTEGEEEASREDTARRFVSVECLRSRILNQPLCHLIGRE